MYMHCIAQRNFDQHLNRDIEIKLIFNIVVANSTKPFCKCSHLFAMTETSVHENDRNLKWTHTFS